MTLPTRTNSTRQLIETMLERGYNKAAGSVVNAVTKNVSSGVVQQRIKELEAEAARLAEIGEKLRPDNPVLRATIADLQTVLNENRKLIDGAAGRLQREGINAGSVLSKELSLPGLNDEQLLRIGIQWNRPNPDAVNALVNFASSPAWAEELRKYAAGSVDDVLNVALRGFVNGWGPRRAAREIAAAVGSMPVYRAENLMRTLHLQSYRRGTTASYLANADILEHRIRVAVLDTRTCIACVVQHGKVLRLDEEVEDHHSGRCGSIGKVKGIDRVVRPGEQWFRALPEERQRQQMGASAWRAWKDGAIRMDDFVERYEDDVFGGMTREASLKGMLGDGAKKYYSSDRVPRAFISRPAITVRTDANPFTGVTIGSGDGESGSPIPPR